MSPSETRTVSADERARLLVGVRALAGASLQKLWLLAPPVAVLQLRLPGRTVLVVVDARLSLAAVAESRPTSPDSAPRSQATLRALLEGSRFDSARLERAEDAEPSSAPAVRLSFSTPKGTRALVAEPGAALLVLAPGPSKDREAAPTSGGEAILWASSGAGQKRRPGGEYPRAQELALPDAQEPLPQAVEIVRRALAEEEAAGVLARRRELMKRLQARVRKLERTRAAVDADAARAEGAAEELRRAELLLPHKARIPRGAREARVPDWNQTDESGAPREVTVPLDPALSAAENIERSIRRARRYLAARPRIAARRAEVAKALATAEKMLERAATIEDAGALHAMEAEAARAFGESVSAKSTPRGRKRASPRLPYRAYRSPTGARILVGRSARDNDALTFRVARGNDLWLHARGVQGSHIVLVDPGPAPDARALADAALLAAHFSSSRGVDGAEVAWTRGKHVKKPKGAPPGSVRISQEKTLRVRLDPNRLALLLASETTTARP